MFLMLTRTHRSLRLTLQYSNRCFASTSSRSDSDTPFRVKLFSLLSPSSWESSLGGGMSRLYPSHIPTSVVEKMALACGSALIAFTDTWRGDMVASLGETTGLPALLWMRHTMLSSPVGRRILTERPMISNTSLSLDSLCHLPENTLGFSYAKFMKDHSFLASERSQVHFIDDEELAYVMLRYRQVHDFWHVVLGMPPTVLGEVAVKWIEFAHTGLPMNALAAFVGPLRLTTSERAVLVLRILPWAHRVALSPRCPWMLNIMYEEHLHEDLLELRERWGIPSPPILA